LFFTYKKNINPNQEENRINIDQKIIIKDSTTIVFDSTKRTPDEKFEFQPLTSEEVEAKKEKYTVQLKTLPGCSGTRIKNSYIVPINNKEPHDHAIVYIGHEPLAPKLEEMANELAENDPTCGYFQETNENKERIATLLENYKKVYKEKDLEKIEKLLKDLKGSNDYLAKHN